MAPKFEPKKVIIVETEPEFNPHYRDTSRD